jgi:Fe-Mn family superoxide dismutase
MNFEVPPLPYAKDALAPHLSAETLEFHYEKHHKTYMNKLKELIGDKPEGQKSLEEIVKTSEGPVFNNAAQVWNHNFYWQSMSPKGGNEPTGALADAIKKDFGDFAKFKEQFSKAAIGQFGSGWAWLVEKDGKLAITGTSNADLPLKHGQHALLTCDVWEHAYYIDYRNARPKYAETFLGHLINWEFAAQNFKK